MTTKTAEKPMRATKLLGQIAKAWNEGKRRVWLEGGTWSSKTWSVLQFIKLIGERYPQPLTISVVAETVPHLKRGAIRDFLAIMGEDLMESHWNKSDFIYNFPGGSVLEFFSADVSSKLRGGRRDVLFINEANNVGYDAYRELDMRTKLFTVCDWNPVSEFWFHENNLGESAENVYIHSTYRDALEVVPKSVIDDIESYQDRDPNWWNVYGLGLVGKIEGLVYPHFKQVKEMPEGECFYGLDYGFAVDPTALVENVIAGENLYSREIFYDDSGLTNDAIARKMDLARIDRRAAVYADPNEPKSAQELRGLGWNVLETVKGPGSVAFGQQKVNQYYQHWTEDSLNGIKEQRNFRFITKREPHTGREYLSDDTTHKFSHAMSARRYAVASYRGAGVMQSRTTISERWDGVSPRSVMGRR